MFIELLKAPKEKYADLYALKLILLVYFLFRSCEKMNVVKENKDLACFYTTKHSWRGK